MLAVACVASLAAATQCRSQVMRYEPARTTLSPYLSLTRLNNGALPNYHALVRPEQRQEQLRLNEQVLRRRQDAQLQRLENDFQRGFLPATETGKRSTFFYPGSRARFLDSSRYFQPGLGVGKR